MKSKKSSTVGKITKFHRKIVETDKIYTPSTQIYDRSLYMLYIGIFKKEAGSNYLYVPKPSILVTI